MLIFISFLHNIEKDSTKVFFVVETKISVKGFQPCDLQPPERYVHPIPAQLESVLRYFHDYPKPPSLQAWNQNLARWSEKSGLNSIGISAKSTRKTLESWMISAGVPLHVVCLSQGHNSLTSMQHYQGLPFTEDELGEIRRRLAGWS